MNEKYCGTSCHFGNDTLVPLGCVGIVNVVLLITIVTVERIFQLIIVHTPRHQLESEAMCLRCRHL